MIIDNIGKYVLTEDKSFRTSNSVFTLSAGSEIEVTQIDRVGRKFYSKNFGDWNYWEQPVVRNSQIITLVKLANLLHDISKGGQAHAECTDRTSPTGLSIQKLCSY